MPGRGACRREPARSDWPPVKDYRGKDATQVVWEFDVALESKIMDALEQAATAV